MVSEDMVTPYIGTKHWEGNRWHGGDNHISAMGEMASPTTTSPYFCGCHHKVARVQALI